MMPQRIMELWAWVSVDPKDGSEGVIGASMKIEGVEMFVPLVGADRARIESYRVYAEAIGAKSKKRIRLIRYSNRTVRETLEPM
jgi:hypothetical protein